MQTMKPQLVKHLMHKESWDRVTYTAEGSANYGQLIAK